MAILKSSAAKNGGTLRLDPACVDIAMDTFERKTCPPNPFSTYGGVLPDMIT